MGTRIMVLKINKTMKIGALIVAAAALLLLFSIIFITKGGENTAYVPGTYSSSIILNNRTVSVNVTVTQDEIADIELSGLDETQAVFYPLFEPTMYDIANEVIEMQSTDISVDTEHSQTAGILLAAIDSALEKAKR